MSPEIRIGYEFDYDKIKGNNKEMNVDKVLRNLYHLILLGLMLLKDHYMP